MAFFTFPHTQNYDGDVGWMLTQVKGLLACCEQMEGWKTEHEAEYLQLKAFCDALIAGEFPPGMEQALYQWMADNAQELLSALLPLITFTLEDDGHLLITMPDGLAELEWRTTGYDITIPGYDYGHLVLIY